MNERLEKNIENYFIKKVKELGGLTIKMGKNGNPDRLALLPYQLFYLVELKSKTGKLTPLQVQVHKKINCVGHRTFVIGSKEKVDEFVEIVKKDFKRSQHNIDFILSFG